MSTKDKIATKSFWTYLRLHNEQLICSLCNWATKSCYYRNRFLVARLQNEQITPNSIITEVTYINSFSYPHYHSFYSFTLLQCPLHQKSESHFSLAFFSKTMCCRSMVIWSIFMSVYAVLKTPYNSWLKVL